MSVLADLQKWYASNCDGEWEHDYGVSINSLDNLGWMVTIELSETNLEGKLFQKVESSSIETSWVECWIEGSKFHGVGDPNRLEDILRIFINWAKSQNEDWLKPLKPMSDEELQKFEDENLINLLGAEDKPELCKHESCTHKRIQYSVMCRRHHFEMVTGRSFPENAS